MSHRLTSVLHVHSSAHRMRIARRPTDNQAILLLLHMSPVHFPQGLKMRFMMRTRNDDTWNSATVHIVSASDLDLRQTGWLSGRPLGTCLLNIGFFFIVHFLCISMIEVLTTFWLSFACVPTARSIDAVGFTARWYCFRVVGPRDVGFCFVFGELSCLGNGVHTTTKC